MKLQAAKSKWMTCGNLYTVFARTLKPMKLLEGSTQTVFVTKNMLQYGSPEKKNCWALVAGQFVKLFRRLPYAPSCGFWCNLGPSCVDCLKLTALSQFSEVSGCLTVILCDLLVLWGNQRISKPKARDKWQITIVSQETLLFRMLWNPAEPELSIVSSFRAPFLPAVKWFPTFMTGFLMTSLTTMFCRCLHHGFQGQTTDRIRCNSKVKHKSINYIQLRGAFQGLETSVPRTVF